MCVIFIVPNAPHFYYQEVGVEIGYRCFHHETILVLKNSMAILYWEMYFYELITMVAVWQSVRM